MHVTAKDVICPFINLKNKHSFLKLALPCTPLDSSFSKKEHEPGEVHSLAVASVHPSTVYTTASCAHQHSAFNWGTEGCYVH